MRDSCYIGMTESAEEFVKNLKIVSTYPFEDGIGNLYYFRIWEIHPDLLPENIPDFMKERINVGMVCIKEVVDQQVWESGVIYLTCPEIDYGNGTKQKCLQWIFNPLLEGWDKKKGQFGKNL